MAVIQDGKAVSHVAYEVIAEIAKEKDLQTEEKSFIMQI